MKLIIVIHDTYMNNFHVHDFGIWSTETQIKM